MFKEGQCLAKQFKHQSRCTNYDTRSLALSTVIPTMLMSVKERPYRPCLKIQLYLRVQYFSEQISNFIIVFSFSNIELQQTVR
jgi:hypothetical protein